MWDSVDNNMLLVSYTINKKTKQLDRNETITIPIEDKDGVTTKFRRAWAYGSNIYYVISSTVNSTGATITSDIYVYDSKLSRLRKMKGNPNPGDLSYGERGGNNSMFPMPPGYIFDDYNVTDDILGTITRHVNIYRQP
jgi:hypothetical protein